MFLIIAYDIADNRRRYRVCRILEACALRVQESVFETCMDDKHFTDILERIRSIIDEATDSVRFYHLDRDWKRRITVAGIQQFYAEEEESIIV